MILKKITIAALTLLSVAKFATAQENSNETDFRETLRFGLKAGINYANVYDEAGNSFKADGKIGFAGGGFISIPLGKYFGIQPEILFSQKGFKAGGSLLGSNYNLKRTSSYIDIPLQISLKPSEFITILAGPQYSYLISQKDEFASSNTSFAQEQVFKNDNIRKNMFGLVVGADVNLKNFILSGRLGWDVSKNNGDGTSTTPRYKNQWVQFTLGYCF